MRDTRPGSGPVESYGIALLSVGIAFAATHATWPLLRPTPWVFFFAAVMVSAWFGGMGPSLVATATAAVLGGYYFIAPYRVVSLAPGDLIPVAMFVGVSLFIGILA